MKSNENNIQPPPIFAYLKAIDEETKKELEREYSKEVADKIYKEIVAKRMSFREEMKKAREEAKYLTKNDLDLLREQNYLCRKNIISFEESIQNRKKIIEQAKQRKRDNKS